MAFPQLMILNIGRCLALLNDNIFPILPLLKNLRQLIATHSSMFTTTGFQRALIDGVEIYDEEGYQELLVRAPPEDEKKEEDEEGYEDSNTIPEGNEEEDEQEDCGEETPGGQGEEMGEGEEDNENDDNNEDKNQVSSPIAVASPQPQPPPTPVVIDTPKVKILPLLTLLNTEGCSRVIFDPQGLVTLKQLRPALVIRTPQAEHILE